MRLNHKQIAGDMVRIALFVLLAKLIAAAKEIVIASRYGVGETVDAYLFVFNLIQWPVAIWFSVLCMVILPLAARIRRSGSGEFHRFRAELLGLTLILGAVLFVVAKIGLSLLLAANWLGMATETRQLAVSMSSWLVWLVPLGLTVSLFSAWAMSAGRHSNTFFEGMPALGILIMVLLIPGGFEPLVWGTLAGTTFQLLALVAPSLSRRELEAPFFTFRSTWWNPFWHGFGIMLAGQFVLTFTGIIDQFFAANLGTGAISSLGYANRILALILGLGATAVFRATLPVFSDNEASGQSERSSIYRSTMQWVWLMFAGGLLVLAVGWVLSPAAVALLYERGAFTSEDTLAVSHILRLSLTQVPFYFASHVLQASLASRGFHRKIAIIYFINLLIKITAAFVLVPLFGLSGLVISTSIMYASRLLFLVRVSRL